MIRISPKLLFAVEAVLDIAYHAGGEPVPSGEITRRQGIPRRYLEQVLQQLVRAGVLVGTRGPKGGYRLARERRSITVGELVRVIEGAEVAEALPEMASDLGSRVVRPMWAGMQQDLMSQLDAVTIEELCDRARAAGITSEAHGQIDFTI